MAHQLTINWTASTDPVDGYNVYRSTISGGESSETSPLNLTLIIGTSYIDTTIENFNTYYYEVRASYKGILSVVSSQVVSAEVLPYQNPSNVWQKFVNWIEGLMHKL